MKKLAIALGIIATISTAAIAAQDASLHHMGDHHVEPATPGNIYAPAMAEMHNGMMVETTGDADVDFVRGMIPHHQGAVAMAKILKENGKDPELQKMADDIIAAQEKEISFMQEWLKKKGY